MPQFVEKIRIAARVAMPREAPIEGSFAVGPQAELHDGPETLLERLNGQDRVVPFQRARDGAVLLLQRLDIEWVEPAHDVPESSVRPPAWRVTREERVTVRMQSGRELHGRLLLELPDDLNRASDFLNGPEDWFVLTTSDGPRLVNKHRVSTTRVFEHSPLPVGGGRTALGAPEPDAD